MPADAGMLLCALHCHRPVTMAQGDTVRRDDDYSFNEDNDDDYGSSGAQLLALIGEESAVRLAEHFGGIRVFIPATEKAAARMGEKIGAEAARTLSREFPKMYIRVPLYRELRVVHYRRQKLSIAKIARRLGMAESGVDKMLRRMKQK